MHSQYCSSSRKISVLTFISSLFLLVFLAGCATKPGEDDLADDGRKTMLAVIDEMTAAQEKRPRCFDADVKIFLTSWMKDRAVSGYTQVMVPDTIKFVTSNPFGQPVLAFVGNQQNFQYVDSLNRLYLDGDINEFASIYEIPLEDFSGPWGDWLTARIPAATDNIIEIRTDQSEDGVWVRYGSSSPQGQEAAHGEYLLINPEKKLLIARSITDEKGKTIARIDYHNRSVPPLSQPQSIKVTNLPYGAELEILFTDVMELESCDNRDFMIKRPASYSYQRLTKVY